MIKSIGTPLGHGHFAQVFSAEDDVHGTVALKVLKRLDGWSDSEWSEMQERLLREGQHLAKATHQNVVQVHYADRGTDGITRLIMELCRGGSIAQEYQAGPIRLSRVRKLATDVALGLDALHKRDMIHRDIKPANILLDQHGTAKLGDFGLITDDIILGYASAGDKDKRYYPHLAKEVWDGKGTSVKTDVWALGMTIYRLCHGEDWYETMMPSWTDVPKGRYAKKLLFLPHVTRPWRSFISKCLNDDPKRRYQNAGNVLSGLARLPVEPDWSCNYAAEGDVVWTANVSERRIEVTWYRPEDEDTEQHWEAVSWPLGAGNKRRLEIGNDLKELDRFFQSRAR